MHEKNIGGIRRVEKVAKEERLDRRGRVNRIKSQAIYLRGGLTVRLQGLKACREAAGLSQRQLAKIIGTNQTTISQLEMKHGWRGAYVSTIRRLCAALEVSFADLICKYEGSEENRHTEWVSPKKGLNRQEQLDALREQASYIRQDRWTRGEWKIRLLGLGACRLAASLTQQDVARMVGRSQTTIATLERGVSATSPRTIRRLCRTLKVLPADLICEEPVK